MKLKKRKKEEKKKINITSKSECAFDLASRSNGENILCMRTTCQIDK